VTAEPAVVHPAPAVVAPKPTATASSFEKPNYD
jgi:hypothetical protein